MTARAGATRSSAFSLVEVLVVIGVIGGLASLLLPTLGKAKAETQSVACRNHLKQLTLAWLSYGHDNDDCLPPNLTAQLGFDFIAQPGSWVVGNAKLDTTTSNVETGVLYNYLKSPLVYRCPADHSTVENYPGLARTRSYAMEHWLNLRAETGSALDDANFSPLNLRRFSRIANPGGVFVFIDEHPVRINDGVFTVPSPWAFPRANVLRHWAASLPAERHNGGDNLSFADGHVEAHRWRYLRDPKTFSNIGSSDNELDQEDVSWLQDRIPKSP